MKITRPIISVIMPTLNSEKTIELSLQSLVAQTYPKEKIEILVIDGGSIDKTNEIAKNFGARIIFNPDVLPEQAKSLGVQNAKGKFAMLLDSDEVLASNTSIQDKVNLLSNNPNCKNIVTSGLLTPQNYSFVSDYINKIGDPFSFFIYRIDSSDFYYSLAKKYSVSKKTKDFTIFKFKQNELTPIVDGGGHFFDLDFLRSIVSLKKPGLGAAIFTSMVSHTLHLGVIKNDNIIHYSSANLKKYLRKIYWRIVNNLSSNNSDAGFSTRETNFKGLVKYKKFLFIPYALTFIFPLIDSIILSIRHKDIRFILHLPLTIMTALLILWVLIKNLVFGSSKMVQPYGK